MGIHLTMSDFQKQSISDLDFFMLMACLSAKRSKDPNTKVGACVVDVENKIVGLGYNGMPNGCSDEELPWSRQGERLDTKYPYVCHAELNAIVNCINADIENGIIYCSMFPCNECAKLIIQSGIKEVIFLLDKYSTTPDVIAAKRMFDLAQVIYRQFKSELKSVVFTFKPDFLFKVDSCDNVIDDKISISWLDYFMAVACLSAARCNDAYFQIGVCIVNNKNRIVGIGNNGSANDVNNKNLVFNECELVNKNEVYKCNALPMAIFTKNCRSLSGCTVYITSYPCCNCAKLIVHYNIKDIVYLHDISSHEEKSKSILDEGAVQCRKYIIPDSTVAITLNKI